jgi:serine phosphatase RsbU (regulator of sigma subunit)
VGGDFYDIIQLDDARTAVVIGDFSGHGIDAAGLAARCRLILSTAIRESQDPAMSLRRANGALSRSISPDQFATAACAVIDQPARTIVLATAGHPAPLLAGRVPSQEFLTGSSTPLGVLEDAQYDNCSVCYRPGDLVVCYTDGLTEARDGDGSFFGQDQLMALSRELCAAEPHVFAEALCAASDDFAARLGDDKLALVLRLE